MKTLENIVPHCENVKGILRLQKLFGLIEVVVVVWWLGCWHGLRTPRESFFFENPKLLGLDRQIGLKMFGAFGVLWPIYQHPFYIQILKIYLGVEVEFGPERIMNLVIVCP